MKEKKASLKQQLYDELKRAIIRCEYVPGQQLSEDQLCIRLGASRTPVRDALGRLEQEGLVSIHAKRGVVVNTVSLSSINELFEVRMRIEPYAVRVYGCRQSDDVYAAFISSFGEPLRDRETLYTLDGRFHQSFIQASGNRYLSMIYGITADQTERYRILTAASERLAETQQEHYEIAAHCLRRDWIRAAQEMEKHLIMSKNSIINLALSRNLNSDNIFETLSENRYIGN